MQTCGGHGSYGGQCHMESNLGSIRCGSRDSCKNSTFGVGKRRVRGRPRSQRRSQPWVSNCHSNVKTNSFDLDPGCLPKNRTVRCLWLRSWDTYHLCSQFFPPHESSGWYIGLYHPYLILWSFPGLIKPCTKPCLLFEAPPPSS